MKKPTHRETKNPTLSARFLADYMAAGARERAKRSIVQACKYRSTARVVQHTAAKAIIANFIRSENQEVNDLLAKAKSLRDRLADSDFETDTNQHNADYVSRFAKIFPKIVLPISQLEPVGKVPILTLNGVRIKTELHLRLRRKTKTNKIRIGAGMLRYAKGKNLPATAGAWQSAYLFGYLQAVLAQEQEEPERKLCITIDGYSGEVFAAPSDSVRRFQEMEAACATIAEWWPNIEPPPNAVLEGED